MRFKPSFLLLCAYVLCIALSARAAPVSNLIIGNGRTTTRYTPRRSSVERKLAKRVSATPVPEDECEEDTEATRKRYGKDKRLKKRAKLAIAGPSSDRILAGPPAGTGLSQAITTLADYIKNQGPQRLTTPVFYSGTAPNGIPAWLVAQRIKSNKNLTGEHGGHTIDDYVEEHGLTEQSRLWSRAEWSHLSKYYAESVKPKGKTAVLVFSKYGPERRVWDEDEYARVMANKAIERVYAHEMDEDGNINERGEEIKASGKGNPLAPTARQ